MVVGVCSIAGCTSSGNDRPLEAGAPNAIAADAATPDMTCTTRLCFSGVHIDVSKDPDLARIGRSVATMCRNDRCFSLALDKPARQAGSPLRTDEVPAVAPGMTISWVEDDGRYYLDTDRYRLTLRDEAGEWLRLERSFTFEQRGCNVCTDESGQQRKDTVTYAGATLEGADRDALPSDAATDGPDGG